MRKAIIASFALAAAAALVIAATATGAGTSGAAIPGCAKGSLNLLKAGTLTVGADNPAFPPWFGGTEKKPWKVSNPYSGKGYESAVVYAIAAQLGFTKAQVAWTAVPFNNSYKPGKKPFDFYSRRCRTHPSGRGRSTSRAPTTSSTRPWWRARARRSRRRRSIAGAEAVQARRPGRHHELHVHHPLHPAELEPERLRHQRRSHPGAQERPDRRDRRRPADGVLRHGRAARRRRDRGQAADEGHEGALRAAFPEGQRASPVRRSGDRQPVGERHDQAPPEHLAREGRRA